MRLLIWASLISFSAFATPLPLSPTFTIKPGLETGRWVFLPAFNAWRLETSWQGEKFQVTAVRNTPEIFANIFSVQRFWKDQSKHLSAQTKVISDSGCQRISKMSFSCQHVLNEKSNLSLEKIYWNAKSDIVFVRISTSKDKNKLADFAKLLNVETISRWPAQTTSEVSK